MKHPKPSLRAALVPWWGRTREKESSHLPVRVGHSEEGKSLPLRKYFIKVSQEVWRDDSGAKSMLTLPDDLNSIPSNHF